MWDIWIDAGTWLAYSEKRNSLELKYYPRTGIHELENFVKGFSWDT
jgi:hypothetical protein